MASTSTHTGKPNRGKKGKEKRSISARIEHGYETTKAAVKNLGSSVFPFQRRKGRGGSGPTVEAGQDAVVNSWDNQVRACSLSTIKEERIDAANRCIKKSVAKGRL